MCKQIWVNCYSFNAFLLILDFIISTSIYFFKRKYIYYKQTNKKGKITNFAEKQTLQKKVTNKTNSSQQQEKRKTTKAPTNSREGSRPKNTG